VFQGTRSSSKAKAVGLGGALALAVCVSIAACGSSATSASTASGPSTSSTGATTSGSTYNVGLIETLTGPLSGDLGGEPVGLDAWEKWTNAHGGVDGHPVQVFVMDDQSNPSIGLQDAKTLVTQDHVLAILGVSDEATTWGPYIEQQGIPIIGGNPDLALNPDYFPTGDYDLTNAELNGAKKAGADHVGVVYCTVAAACARAVPEVKSVGQKIGVTESYAAGVALNQPSYTATCLAAKQHGADAIYELVDLTTVLTLATDCSQQGYSPVYVGGSIEAGASYVKGLPSGSTMVVGENVFPWFVHSTPATEQYWNALEQYEPGVFTSNNYNPSLAMAWTSGEMFAAAAAHLGSNPTPAGVKAGLYSLKNETLGGLIGPTTYVPGQASTGSGYFIVVLKNGQYTAPYGVTSFVG
jgi:branched-chain amino acid transport system substrate-binding protein